MTAITVSRLPTLATMVLVIGLVFRRALNNVTGTSLLFGEIRPKIDRDEPAATIVPLRRVRASALAITSIVKAQGSFDRETTFRRNL
jgi:hypothetical protein